MERACVETESNGVVSVVSVSNSDHPNSVQNTALKLPSARVSCVESRMGFLI